MQYIHLDEIGSTNTWMMQRLEGGAAMADQTVAYTMRQTAGRGQMGNRWDSEPDKNISFSMLIHPASWHTVQPPLGVARGFVVSQIAALAVAEALNDYADGFVCSNGRMAFTVVSIFPMRTRIVLSVPCRVSSARFSATLSASFRM